MSSISKTVVLVIILFGAHAVFGIACQGVETYFPMMIQSGVITLLLTAWVIGSFFILTIAAGLFTILVPRFRIVFYSFGLASLLMVLAWEFNWVTVIAGMIYWIVVFIYSRAILHQKSNTLHLTRQVIEREQSILLSGLIFVMATSFSLGYVRDIYDTGSVFPTGMKEIVTGYALNSFSARLDEQGITDDYARRLSQYHAAQELDQFWIGLERTFAPVSALLPILAGLIVLFILNILLQLLAWIPPRVIEIILRAMVKFHWVQVIDGMMPTQRLTLE